MNTQPDHKHFPQTPYPFDQPHEFAGLASISEWLELSEQTEEYHAESNALTPEDWIACDGKEDPTWIVGELDWLEEDTKDPEVITGRSLEAESVPSSANSNESISDLSSPPETLAEQTQSNAEASGSTQPLISGDKSMPLRPTTPQGVTRKRNSQSSDEEFQLPERKRPRLERLIIEKSQHSIASPRLLTPHYEPTPVSPIRQFYKILAEKSSEHGVMYKVLWRESWVHESKMPDIEPIKYAQYMQFGETWDVLPYSLSSPS
ncbi:hypothetical protein Q7P37_004897 [Cladosporium fusiforme]